MVRRDRPSINPADQVKKMVLEGGRGGNPVNGLNKRQETEKTVKKTVFFVPFLFLFRERQAPFGACREPNLAQYDRRARTDPPLFYMFLFRKKGIDRMARVIRLIQGSSDHPRPST